MPKQLKKEAFIILILGEFDDLGVEDVADLAIDVPGEGTQTDPDLVSTSIISLLTSWCW